MIAAQVDPALFRLRAFEEEWIEPRYKDGAPLSALLIIEADMWLALGRAIGYFADAPLWTKRPKLASSSRAQPVIDSVRSQPRVSVPDVQMFDRALNDAREALTPQSEERLRLLIFAPEDEWADAVKHVMDFARRPWPSSMHGAAFLARSNRSLDRVAWALEGAMSDDQDDRREVDLELPAAWRLGSLARLAACSDDLAGRVSELARARAAVDRSITEGTAESSPSIVVRPRRRSIEEILSHLDYDPRTDTGIPTEPVGSLPRPAKLQAAFAEYDEGKISKEDLEKLQDEACKDSIERGEATGAPIISDGEQRWSSTMTYPIADTLAGTGLAEGLAPGGQFFAIFADGHGRQLPRLVGGPLKYNFYAADTLAKSLPYASKPMKQAVIAPSMLALLYPLRDPVEGYSREEFEEDIVQECVIDIRKTFEAGAKRVSIDFTEGRLAMREDPRNPWTGAGLLPHFIELNNRVLENFSDEERTKIGIHTCPGGDRDSVHSADVPYSNLLPEMFKINAGYFLIQLASERDKDTVYELIGEHSREDQMCYIGVTVTQSPRPESAEEICDQIVRAADFIPKERLGTTDDCGFSPFSIDEKPNHGSPDYAREIAFTKITNRVEGTRRAAEKLGVG